MSKKEKIYTLVRDEMDYESSNEFRLITVREKDSEKLEELLKKIDEYEEKNCYIPSLSNYIVILSNDSDQRKNPKIMISDFIMKEIITTTENYLYFIESALDYIFISDNDISNLIFETRDEGMFRWRFEMLDKDDRYDEEINDENGVDWDKFKRTLLAYSRYYAKNLIKIREFCLNNQYDEDIYNNFKTNCGHINKEDYDIIISNKMNQFFDGIEHYDENILPTVESYVDNFINYFRNHPLSPYICTLKLYMDSVHEDTCCIYNIRDEEILDEL